MVNNRNRLALEKSPYLLQHADNPVDWYPWGPEAFERALKENKPVLLSIGYSTCHWCHVMAHESFEDAEVANMMNETFINIKVDREERPDIDGIYMEVCQMMTGSGGWPLTIIMTPDKRPFFSGTYFPKESRFGLIGMTELIPRIRHLWENENRKLLDAAGQITEALRVERKGSLSAASAKYPDDELIKSAYDDLHRRFDEEHGGFGSPPKFPLPQRLLLLLRYWKRTADDRALFMVEKTLEEMRMGGIYDHIGFGFHRYSTDEYWLVPHFEKMLYDQALLAMAYTEAYQATKKDIYKKTAFEIFTYVQRDMTSPAGGFYSAEDADSEGEEGKFYVWSKEEIEKALGSESAIFLKAYNIETNGNFKEQVSGKKTGRNIVYMKKDIGELSQDLNIQQAELAERLEMARVKLLITRSKRVRPHMDDKVLTDWNGLMIAAFAMAARIFDRREYASAAKKASDFILSKMRAPDARLLHRYRDGESGIKANANDYAFLIWGLIELYESSFDTPYLRAALELNKDFIEHFSDKASWGFYFTPDDAEELLIRQKEIHDGAIPSANSVAMMDLLRLGRLTGTQDLEKVAVGIWNVFDENIRRSPSSFSQALMAADFMMGASYEVVITGRSDGKDTAAMLKALRDIYVPNMVVLLRPTETEPPDITNIAGYTANQKEIDGRATAYVCRNFKCAFPTADISEMRKLLMSHP